MHNQPESTLNQPCRSLAALTPPCTRTGLLALLLAAALLFAPRSASAQGTATLPEGFVYLSELAPDIPQDIRYAGSHNFIGRPIDGYRAPECILTLPAAEAVLRVHAELARSGLGVKIYDCYRPTRAVADFVAWSALPDQYMKAEFYPDVDKRDFFKLGYVAEKSSHSRGSTVDLTIVPLDAFPQPDYNPVQKLKACYAPRSERFPDISIDMGTGYDCFDPLSHPANEAVGIVPFHNRQMLRALMVKNGFAPYDEEWWHFTLKNEPFPATSFDFPVDPR